MALRAQELREGRVPPQLRHLRGDDFDAAAAQLLDTQRVLAAAADDVGTIRGLVEEMRTSRDGARRRIERGQFADAAAVLEVVCASYKRLRERLPVPQQAAAQDAKHGAAHATHAAAGGDASAGAAPAAAVGASEPWRQELSDASYTLFIGERCGVWIAARSLCGVCRDRCVECAATAVWSVPRPRHSAPVPLCCRGAVVPPPECQLDLGRCRERLGLLHAAEAVSNSLRDVLIADDGCIPAWVVRGRCFAAMDAFQLAALHFEKACVVQKLAIPSVLDTADVVPPLPVAVTAGAAGAGSGGGSSTSGSSSTSSVDALLSFRATLNARMLRSRDPRVLVLLARAGTAARVVLSDGDLATADARVCVDSVSCNDGVAAAAAHWRAAVSLKAQGDAIMREAFFGAADVKYRAALLCVRQCSATAAATAAAADAAALLQLEFACHLNSAVCCSHRGVDASLAVKACDEAIRVASVTDASGARGLSPHPTVAPCVRACVHACVRACVPAYSHSSLVAALCRWQCLATRYIVHCTVAAWRTWSSGRCGVLRRTFGLQWRR